MPRSGERDTRIGRRKRRRRIRRIRNCLIILLVVVVVIPAALYYGFYRYTGTTVIDCYLDARTTVLNSSESDFKPDGITHIYDCNGVLLAELSKDKASNYLAYDEIPQNVVNAFVAVEDRTFWTNQGYSLKGIARSALGIFTSGGSSITGGSTITQQLSKLVYLSNEKTVERKTREIFLAMQLTGKYEKEQIMEFYVNNCCFANNIYGISDAAQTYFSKSIMNCTLSETAYLCAIPNRPEYYNPLKYPENAINRRDKILSDMLDCGFISENEYESAIDEEITVKSNEETEFYNYETTYAIHSATEFLMKHSGFTLRYNFSDSEDYEAYQEEYDENYQNAKQKLYTGGYTILTSIDVDKQKELQKAVDSELSSSTSRNESTGTYNLQGALTAIDNSTGKVIGIVGGREDSDSDGVYTLNRAYQSYRQPGSSIKPLVVYTPALELGKTKDSTLKEISVSSAYKNPSKISSMSGTSYSLENAVINSRNGCAIYLYNEVTPSRGLKYIQEMGFRKIIPDDYNLSSGLGGLTYGTTTLEMANAYSTLANGGMYTSADCLLSVLDSDSNEIYDQDYTYRVYLKDSSDKMTDILRKVITSGTARSMSWSSYSDVQAAGKTGTTNSSKDAWFCGYTPDYTIAVWVGNDDNTAVSNMYGSGYPSRIWRSAMLSLLDKDSTKTFG